MDELTLLDQAHAEMQASPDNLMARHRFYQRLADAELVLLLDAEPSCTSLSPRILVTQGTKYALVFDRDARLAEFVQEAVSNAAMAGRAVVGLLAGQGIGLGLNLGVAPSSILLPPGAIDWMADMLNQAPAEISERPVKFAPPENLPDGAFAALSTVLAGAGDIVVAAYLLDVTYASGNTGTILAVIGAPAGSEQALTQAVNDALLFWMAGESGIDVAFFRASDPVCQAITDAGLQLAVPSTRVVMPQLTAPGKDPDKPPRLF